MASQEEEIRARVRQLRSYYTTVLVFGAMCIICIFAWLLSGGGYFWPIWVILGSGVLVVLQAFELGMIPMLESCFPFLRPDWEDKQVKEMLKQKTTQPKPLAKGKSSKTDDD